MSATVISAADVVASVIAAGSFGQPIVAERKFLNTTDLAKLGSSGTLKATVFGQGLKRELADRVHVRKTPTVDVIVHKVVTSDDECEGLLELCEKIGDAFFKKHFASIKADCKKVDDRCLYDPDSLKTSQLFASLIRITFEIVS